MADNFGVNSKKQPDQKPSPKPDTVAGNGVPSVDESPDSVTMGVVSKKSYGA